MSEKPDYAGLREWYRNHFTRGFVGVYDGREADMDTDGGRWQTVCEEHGLICSHRTLALAKVFGRQPSEWCEGCMSILDSNRRQYDEPGDPFKGESPNEHDWRL